MKSLQIQIPADVHTLIQMLFKMGIQTGPMKACSAKEGHVDIWFVCSHGATAVKRVSADLVEGDAIIAGSVRRRVYLNVSLQDFDGEWRTLSDGDYESAGLEAPWAYSGEQWIGVDYDISWGGHWSDTPDSCHEKFPYFPLKEGDRQRAISEAKVAIGEYNEKIS